MNQLDLEQGTIVRPFRERWTGPLILMSAPLWMLLYMMIPGTWLADNPHVDGSNGRMGKPLIALVVAGVPFLIGAFWGLVVLAMRVPFVARFLEWLAGEKVEASDEPQPAARPARNRKGAFLAGVVVLILVPLADIVADALKNQRSDERVKQWHLELTGPSVAQLSGSMPLFDEAAVFSPEQQEALRTTLFRLRGESAREVVVVTLPSTDEFTPRSQLHRIYSTLRMDRPGSDNGILVLVLTNDRQAHVKLGRELTQLQPEADRVVREVMLPRFANGDWQGGVEAGVDVLAHVGRMRPVDQAARASADSIRR